MLVFNWKILADSFEKSFIFFLGTMEVFNVFLLAVNFPISARKPLSHDSFVCLDFNTVIVCIISYHLPWHVSLQAPKCSLGCQACWKDFYANYNNLQMVSVMKGHSSALRQPAAFRHMLNWQNVNDSVCRPPPQIPQRATTRIVLGALK